MNFLKKRPLLFWALVFLGISILIRFGIYDLENMDTIVFERWYEFLLKRGWHGLANVDFSNYPPAYLYLLWISTFFTRWFDPLTLIKILPTCFDLLSTFFIFLILRLRYKGDEPILFACMFTALPTVMMNSTGWGQIDSLYVSFLLGCVYFLLVERPFWGLVFFGMAISFKAQAIFLLPLLGILLLKRRIPWQHFFIIPFIYLLLGLPAALIGRSWESIIGLYVGQAGQFEVLAMNGPNLYFFIPDIYYQPVLRIGLLIFFMVMLAWAYVSLRSRVVLTQYGILFTALVSLAAVPFLLPKMHDRYFYPADVFSFVVAVFNPELWFLPVLYQLISGLAYTGFLFQWPTHFIMIAALINTITVAFVIKKYISTFGDNHVDA